MYINYRCKNKTIGCSKDISHNKLEKMFIKKYPEFASKTLNEKKDYLNNFKESIYIDNNVLKVRLD